jgi:hypothetical protein
MQQEHGHGPKTLELNTRAIFLRRAVTEMKTTALFLFKNDRKYTYMVEIT